MSHQKITLRKRKGKQEAENICSLYIFEKWFISIHEESLPSVIKDNAKNEQKKLKHCTKEDLWVVIKHMKRSSTSLVISGIQIKTPMR